MITIDHTFEVEREIGPMSIHCEIQYRVIKGIFGDWDNPPEPDTPEFYSYSITGFEQNIDDIKVICSFDTRECSGMSNQMKIKGKIKPETVSKLRKMLDCHIILDQLNEVVADHYEKNK